jgi:hypothetical protein
MAKLTKPARDRISATKFAFPKQRKEPLENASHVRNAVARFNQVSEKVGCRFHTAPWGSNNLKEQSVYATASFLGAAVACFASRHQEVPV